MRFEEFIHELLPNLNMTQIAKEVFYSIVEEFKKSDQESLQLKQDKICTL